MKPLSLLSVRARVGWLPWRRHLMDARERLSCFERIAERLEVPQALADPGSPVAAAESTRTPVLQPGEQPQGLRWYAQRFTGCGASLLDHTLRQTRLGLGVSSFEF